METKVKNLQVRLPFDRYLQFRIEVSKRDTTFQEALAQAIDLWLARNSSVEAAFRNARISQARGMFQSNQPHRVLSEELSRERRREGRREQVK